MKTGLLAAVLIAALTGLFFWKQSQRTSKKDNHYPYKDYLSCQGYPFDLNIKSQGHVYLVKRHLPQDEKELAELFNHTVFYQNMYTFINLIDINRGASELKWAGLANTNVVIKVTKVRDAPYPMTLEFETDFKNRGYSQVQGDYMAKLMSSGRVTKGEPAVRISYEYKNDMVTCFTSHRSESFDNLKFPQPLDPYLAYFMVPKEDRRPINNPVMKTEGIVNPCVDPSFITPNGVYAFGYQHSWRPFYKGVDKNNNPFDCTKYFRDGETIEFASVSKSSNRPAPTHALDFSKFENLNRPIRSAIFFSSIESKFKDFDKEGANKYIDLYLSNIDTQTAREKLPRYKNLYDASFSRFLLLLTNLSKHIEIRDKAVTITPKTLHVVIRGKFKLSKKDIELKFHVYSKDSVEGSKFFAESFQREFLTNDIVTYDGHADYGTAFHEGLKRFKDSQKINENKEIEYQIFGIFSCNSKSLYRSEKFPRISHEKFHRDLITVAANYVEGAAMGTLAVLTAVDSYLYNESTVPFYKWANALKSDNLYILTNH